MEYQVPNLVNGELTGPGAAAVAKLVREVTDPMNGADHNVVIGVGALPQRSYPNVRNNNAVGRGALAHMTKGRYNDFFGLEAGYSLDGGSASESTNVATRNSGFGSNTQRFNRTGRNNVSMGRNALQANVTGNSNTALGAGAVQGTAHMRPDNSVIVNQLPQNVEHTTAVGNYTLPFAVETRNTAVGSFALNNLVNGTGNTAVGAWAGESLGFGSALNGKTKVATQDLAQWQNLPCEFKGGKLIIQAPQGHSLVPGFMLEVSFVGQSWETQFYYVESVSGLQVVLNTEVSAQWVWSGRVSVRSYATNDVAPSPSGNVAIGRQAGRFLADGATRAADVSNAVAIGLDARFMGDNTVMVGNPRQTVYVPKPVETVSDERAKKDIKPLELGLDFLSQLRPVTFSYLDGETAHSGFIAQEVDAVGGFTGVNGSPDDDRSRMSIAYEEFIPVLVNAVVELSGRVKELEGR